MYTYDPKSPIYYKRFLLKIANCQYKFLITIKLMILDPARSMKKTHLSSDRAGIYRTDEPAAAIVFIRLLKKVIYGKMQGCKRKMRGDISFRKSNWEPDWPVNCETLSLRPLPPPWISHSSGHHEALTPSLSTLIKLSHSCS